MAPLTQGTEGKEKKRNLRPQGVWDGSRDQGGLCLGHVCVGRYLRVVLVVEPRQQPHHGAHNPGMHDHGVTFLCPAERESSASDTSPSRRSLLSPNSLDFPYGQSDQDPQPQATTSRLGGPEWLHLSPSFLHGAALPSNKHTALLLCPPTQCLVHS